MNLLELLKQELKTKNIIDKELIARYIYIRIGELFDYDESYLFENWDEQQNIVNQWDKQIGYRKNTEIMLSMLKKELQEKYPNKEDYIYNSYKAVQYIMQFPKERMEHTSGRKYIHFLLKYFLEDLYKYCNGKFYSIENNIFIQAYGVQLSNQFIYYLYRRKNKQGYSFQEVPKKTIKFLFQEKILKRAYTQELEKTL